MFKKSFEEAWPEISGLFGLEELPVDARKPVETAYNALVGNGKSPQGGLAGACGAAVSKAAGIGWQTGGHTGTPVPTTAIGIGSERFAGEYDNVDLQKRLRELVTR